MAKSNKRIARHIGGSKGNLLTAEESKVRQRQRSPKKKGWRDKTTPLDTFQIMR